VYILLTTTYLLLTNPQQLTYDVIMHLASLKLEQFR